MREGMRKGKKRRIIKVYKNEIACEKALYEIVKRTVQESHLEREAYESGKD